MAETLPVVDRSSLRAMVVSGSGSLIAPLINLLSIPVVMRLYGPEEYGIWGMLMSVAFILGQVSTLRYELAAVVVRSDRDAGRVLSLAILAIVGFTGLAYGAAWLLPRILTGSWDAALKPRLWALPVLVAMMGAKLVADGWAVREKAFTLRAVSLVLLAAGTNGTQILLSKLGHGGADGLVLGSVAGFSLAGLLPLVVLATRDQGRLRPLGRWDGLGAMAREHHRFPLYSSPYTILGNLRREGIRIVAGIWGSEASVGLLTLAWRLTYFPAQACSNGIRPVLFQRAAAATDHLETARFILTIQRFLLLAGLPVLAAFLIWTEPLVGFAVGDRWLPSVPLLRILAVPAAIFVLTNWLDRIFDVLGRQDLILRLELIFTLLSLAALAAGYRIGGTLVSATAGLSFVLVVYYAVVAWTVRRLLRGDPGATT